MTYPDDDTATSVSGQADGQAGSASVSLSWQEQGYTLRGRRNIDFNGSYAATVTGDHMDADWRRGNRPIVQFTMTAADDSKTLAEAKAMPSAPASTAALAGAAEGSALPQGRPRDRSPAP